jgi:hypothetical protein
MRQAADKRSEPLLDMPRRLCQEVITGLGKAARSGFLFSSHLAELGETLRGAGSEVQRILEAEGVDRSVVGHVGNI